MTEFVTTANGNLRLPVSAYNVKGNLIEVRRPLRKEGDAAQPIPYSQPFVPHWGQRPIWYDLKTRHQIMLAGSQGGKSHIGPLWMWREIERTLANATEGVEYLFGVIGPTLQMQRQATVGIARMVRFLEQRFGWTEEMILNKQDLRVDLRPVGLPVHIYSGSAERRNRLQGARLEAAWIDEGGMVRDKAIFYTTVQRLHGAGRLLITTTPYLMGAEWLKGLIEEAEGGSPDMTVVRFSSIVNPYFSLEEERTQKNMLPWWYFNMMYNAQFEKPQGLVYPDVQYIEPFAIPEHWIRLIGIDPTHGGSDEFAAVWMAYDPLVPDTWYAYREFYLPCTPKVTAVDQRWRGPHEMLDMIYAMSMIETMDEETGEVIVTERREDIRRIFVDPSKKETLYDVQARFTEAQVFSADSKLSGLITVGSWLKTGKLLVFNSLIHWADEQTSYMYPYDEFGDTIGDVPLDRNNHLMDASRYVIRQSDASRSLAEPSFA